jgi:hypothetical protein
MRKTGKSTVNSSVLDFTRAAARIAIMWAVAFSMLILNNSSEAGAADISRILNFQAGYITDSNIYRDLDARDREKDKAATFGLSLGRRTQLTQAERLSLTADIGSTSYKNSKDYNNTAAGLTASFFAKPGVGPLKPWVRIFTTAARQNYNDNYWDGSQYELGIQAGKRVSDNFDLAAVFALQNKTSPNDVYSSNSYTTSITAGYKLFGTARLAAEYSFRRGDVTLHSEDGWPAGTPWLYDDAIGYYAYRVPAKTHVLTFTATYPLGRNMHFFITREMQNTEWGSESYPNNIFRTGLFFSAR